MSLTTSQRLSVLLLVAALGTPGATAATRRRAVQPISGSAQAVQSAPQRLLLPIFKLSLGDAFGPFKAVLAAHNAAPAPVVIDGFSRECSLGPCPEPFPPATALSPGETVVAPASNLTDTPARLVFVPGGARVDIGLRLTNPLSPTNSVEAPVVRESDFRTGPVSLLEVIGGTGVRNSLRLYTSAPAVFTVRFFRRLANDRMLAETTVVTSAPQSRYEPAYAELNDFPTDGSASPISLRIEIVAQDSATGFWALASSFDTKSQALSLVTMR